METPQPASAPQGAEALGLALARVFVVMPLYPADHEQVRSVGGVALEALRAVADAGSCVRIEVRRRALRVAGAALQLAQDPLKRLQRDLFALGVARVEIDLDATPSDLHVLTQTLTAARRKLDASAGFTQLELEALPTTIRVVQREFGRRGEEAAGSAEVMEAIARVLEAEEVAGLPAEKQEVLRNALEQVFEKVVEVAGDGGAAGASFERSLDEVLELGVHALRHALTELTATGSDPGELRTLFDATEKALSLSEDRGSVEVLLSVLAESKREEAKRATTSCEADPTTYVLSVDELREALAAYGDADRQWTRLEREDRREPLSILLHVLAMQPDPDLRESASAAVVAGLEQPLTEPEAAWLGDALEELADRDSPAALDAVLPPVVRGLRASQRPAHLAALWQGLAEGGAAHRRAALWPHAADQLLQGVPRTAPELRALLENVLADASARRGDGLERLLALDTCAQGRIGADALAPVSPALRAVLPELLLRAEGNFGEALLAALRRAPPAGPAGAALLTFPSCTPACRKFLFALLRDDPEQGLSPNLADQARRLLDDAIRTLPRGERKAPWVPRAVEALGEVAGPQEERLLRSIRGGLLPWPGRSWPPACRAAAARALAARRGTRGGRRG